MGSFVDFFESVEKLAYRVLLWIILIPKTFVRIIIDPTWAPGYIRGELKKEKSQFDSYVSPIILFLVVALIPALIIVILPNYGVTINSPAESNPTTDRVIEFDAETTFISASDKMRDQYSWYVEKSMPDGNGDFQYPEIYRETYNEFDQKSTITDPENSYEGQPLTFLYPDQTYNSSNDVFVFAFDPGDYYVNVEVRRADSHNNTVPLEEYSSDVYVYIPENSDELVQVSHYNDVSEDTKGTKLTKETFTDQFSKERTIFLALLLMIPPLLFTLATKVFTAEVIGENSLRENFYVQCYYFSPPSLAVWATFYGVIYYTKDIFFYNDGYVLVVLLPYALAFIWFISAETLAIAEARRINVWQSFLLVVWCTSIILIGIIVWALIVVFNWQDSLRKLGILAYPVITITILLGYSITRLRGWLIENKKFSFRDAIQVVAFLFTMAIFAGCYLLSIVAYPDTSTLAETMTAVPPFGTADTSIPTIFAINSPIPFTAMPISLGTSTPAGNPIAYKLQPSEFPYCIARRFNVDPKQLLALNNLVNSEISNPGTVLKIPQSGEPFPGNRALRGHPTTYIVTSSSETIYSIACLFGDVDPEAIVESNGILISVPLTIGQQLNIP
jgi:LysM domain-containing protein